MSLPTVPRRLERPVPPGVVRAILESGYAHVTGAVAQSADIPAMSAADTIRLWRLDSPGPRVDADALHVMTFDVHPLMRLSPASTRVGYAGALYPTGFLAAPPVVPVWWLERTRLQRGAALWRVAESGERTAIAHYDGLALGWRESRGYLPPTDLVGPRAQWRGQDLPVEISADAASVELVTMATAAPDGFDLARPRIWRRTVAVAELDRVFELTLTCVLDGVRCRIIGQRRDSAVVQLMDEDAAAATRLGARQVDFGVFEVEAPRAQLTAISGTTVELPAVPRR